MTGSYPHPCIGNNIAIKFCLMNVVLDAFYAVELALVEYAGSASVYMLYYKYVKIIMKKCVI
jgi:hypothetical protein